MVRHTQTIHRLFDHFMGLALKGLSTNIACEIFNEIIGYFQKYCKLNCLILLRFVLTCFPFSISESFCSLDASLHIN